MQSAGGVDDHDVMLVATRVFERGLAIATGRAARVRSEVVGADLFRQALELRHRRRAIHVRARKQHLAPVLLDEVARELRGGRRLARALEPRQQHDDRRRRVQVEAAARSPMTRVSSSWITPMNAWPGVRLRITSVPTARARAASVKDFTTRHGDVRLEQRHAHLAQRVGDVLLGQPAAAAQRVDGLAEPVGEHVEHRAAL